MVVLRKPQAFGCLRTLCVAGLLTALAASGGCETAAGTGAAAGGLLGAGIGGLVSHGCPGATLAGAHSGAGAGLVGGAMADGFKANKAQRAAAADVAVRAPGLGDIVSMTQSAVPPEQIIGQIRSSGVVYRLTPEQVIWLNQQGVNSAVISEMQATAYRAPGRVVYTAAPAVQPVYVYGPPPPPPVAVGVGVGFR